MVVVLGISFFCTVIGLVVLLVGGKWIDEKARQLKMDNDQREIKQILGFAGGGVHKRIDENRELLELLQRDGHSFLKAHPWVEGWLESNDEFFVSLESKVPITEGRYLTAARLNPGRFPRPWPGMRPSNSKKIA